MEGETKMTLYIKVTKDRYELPVAVAESKSELARILKVDPSTITCGLKRKVEQPVYLEVEVDDNE